MPATRPPAEAQQGDRRGATVSEGAGSDEEILKGIIGQPTGKSTVVIERGPVSFFADAVLEQSPIYKDPGAAQAVGLANIPAPPTFAFAVENWGKFPELQPTDALKGSPLMTALGPLIAKGGIILHGEQEFVYHRPVVVGDVLVGEGTVVDAYQKESKGKTMTFVVSETTFVDQKSGDPVVTARFNVLHRI
jgi:acyl dehydratase